MDNVVEIKEALSLGLEGFRAFIEQKLKEEPDYLNQFFCFEDGVQRTLLNYLIQQHQEEKDSTDTGKKVNLIPFMDFILELSTDKNAGEPLHFAISLGKHQLVLHFLDHEELDEQLDLTTAISHLRSVSSKQKKKWAFDVNRRDYLGRTLLSLILELKKLNLLSVLLQYKPNIHAPTSMFKAVIMSPPIHQAIVLDYADGVHLLAHEGAKLAYPIGSMMDTPLTLSARLGVFKAMDALLEYPQRVMLDARNKRMLDEKKTGHTAIEELCRHIANKKHTEQALSKVAMLLSCGAQPPEDEDMRRMLASYRMTLLREIERYLENKPEHVDAFVSRCHEKGSALHEIFYGYHSFSSSMRRFFGKPSGAALIIENLVVRKYNKPTTPLELPLSIETAEQLKNEKNPLKLYAEFVRRYTQAYDNQMISNRWSSMRWMIAEGRCDWKSVVEYARTHPNSRTRIVWHEMFHPLPKVYEGMDLPEAKAELASSHQ